MTASPAPGMPSAEAIEAEIRPMAYEAADLTECVERILDLIRPAFEAKEREIRELRMQALSDEGQMRELQAKLSETERDLAGLRQCILDSAVICDDDEKASDRLDRLAAAIRAASNIGQNEGEKT